MKNSYARGGRGGGTVALALTPAYDPQAKMHCLSGRTIALALSPGLPSVETLRGEDRRRALGVDLGIVEVLNVRGATILS